MKSIPLERGLNDINFLPPQTNKSELKQRPTQKRLEKSHRDSSHTDEEENPEKQFLQSNSYYFLV
jgi:hypothetical protein